MRRVVSPLVTMLVMVLVGRPVLGQGQTTIRPTWADTIVGTWVLAGERAADVEFVVLRPDSTALIGGYRKMASDTFAWFVKNPWSVTRYSETFKNYNETFRMSNANIYVWVGREVGKEDKKNYNGRASASKNYESNNFFLRFNRYRYKRVDDSTVVLVNRLHPRPVPAPTGTLAQLLGTWEQQDSVSTDGRVAISRSTIRADSTVVKTVLSMQGTDTLSLDTHLETVVVSGDTLWWGGWFDPNAKPRRIGRGRTVVVQDDQLTLFKVETPTVPDQVYKRVASPTPP